MVIGGKCANICILCIPLIFISNILSLQARKLKICISFECTGISTKSTSLTLLVMLFLIKPRIQLAFWTASMHCCLMLSFSSTNTSKTFSPSLLSIHSLPWLHLGLGLLQPRCRPLQLDFMRFAWTWVLSLSRSPRGLVDWMSGKNSSHVELKIYIFFSQVGYEGFTEIRNTRSVC